MSIWESSDTSAPTTSPEVRARLVEALKLTFVGPYAEFAQDWDGQKADFHYVAGPEEPIGELRLCLYRRGSALSSSGPTSSSNFATPRITLVPVNFDFESIVLIGADEQQVVAELVGVLEGEA